MLDGVIVSDNSGSDGGAFEVAEQAGSAFGIKTQLNVTVRAVCSRGPLLRTAGCILSEASRPDRRWYSWMQNSLLENNRASGQGGAVNAVSSDGVFFSNVTFRGNSGLLSL